jgi:hypothetical protein
MWVPPSLLSILLPVGVLLLCVRLYVRLPVSVF